MEKVKPRILIVAEWDGFGEFFSSFLTDNNFKVTVVEVGSDIARILSELSRRVYSVIILMDSCFPYRELPEALSKVKEKYPELYCMVLSGEQKPDFVIELERRGEDDFLPLPINTDYLLRRIQKALNVKESS